MQLEHVPLLSLQRDLYRLPRGQERFEAYLRTMVEANGHDLRLPPLVAMNPMGKDHLPALLDALLALDAEDVAAAAAAEAGGQLADPPGNFKLGLVVADDAKGGWTNRWTAEFALLFESEAQMKRGWLAVTLWSSEIHSEQTVREATLGVIFRTAHILQHGPARTLREMLTQEGFALARAGSMPPALESDDLARTQRILAPWLDTTERTIQIPALFGDRAAEELGYTPLGLRDRAGLALALAVQTERAMPQQ